MKNERVFLWIGAILLPVMAATPAAAYVGPGAGLSLLGALWGVVIAIGAAIAFVVLWPLRRFLRKSRAGVATVPGREQAAPSRAPREDTTRHGAF